MLPATLIERAARRLLHRNSLVERNKSRGLLSNGNASSRLQGAAQEFLRATQAGLSVNEDQRRDHRNERHDRANREKRRGRQAVAVGSEHVERDRQEHHQQKKTLSTHGTTRAPAWSADCQTSRGS